MTDAPVYMIANFEIHDSEVYRAYEKGFFPMLKRHGGEFMTFDDNPDTLEGDASLGGRVVVLRFPNEEAARNWYADPDYQALSEHRRAGSTLHFLTLVRCLASEPGAGGTPYADRTSSQ